MSVRPTSGTQSTAPLLAFQHAPDTGVTVPLLGGDKKKIEQLKQEYLQLSGEVSRLKAQLKRIDESVMASSDRNINAIEKQQINFAQRIENLEILAGNNRADRSQFLAAMRVIMSNLLLGKRPMDVSLEEESLLRALGIHKEFGLTRMANGELENPYLAIQGRKMMTYDATPSDKYRYYYYGWGKKDSGSSK